jgi:hypothetical protein
MKSEGLKKKAKTPIIENEGALIDPRYRQIRF